MTQLLTTNTNCFKYVVCTCKLNLVEQFLTSATLTVLDLWHKSHLSNWLVIDRCVDYIETCTLLGSPARLVFTQMGVKTPLAHHGGA